MVGSTDSQDRRYRVLVILQRSDRPRYYDFHCSVCQYKVCELSNTEVVAIQDLMDTSNHTLVGVRCDGRYRGGRCDTWYYFSLSDRPPRTSISVKITPPVLSTRATIRAVDSPK